MDLYSRTIHQRGSWTESEYQSVSERILHLYSSEEIGDTVPVWTSASKHRYQYVRATRFSESKYWRESRHWSAVTQEEHNVMTSLSTSMATEEMETLTFMDNLTLQPTSVRSCQVVPTSPTAVAPVRQEESMTFVGNFTHPPGVSQDEMIALLNSVKAQAPVSGDAGSHGATFTQRTLLNPAMPRSSGSGNVKDTHPSTTVNVQISAQELQSATASHQMDTEDLTHVGTIYSSTAPSNESMESLNNVMGHITQSNNTAALLNKVGPLTFVGNFDLLPEVHHQQNMKLKPTHVPGDVTQREDISLGITPTPPALSAAPVIPSTGAYGNVPASSFSSPTHYTTREEYLEMLEYHRHMASYYKQLRLKAENTSEVDGSMLRRKRVGVLGGSVGEPPQKRCLEGIDLPDDVVEELCAIPGVWDLAIELGILTVCQAEELKGL